MSLVPPRFSLPVVDKNGNVTREWYQYLVSLGKSLQSNTMGDDLQTLVASQPAPVDGKARRGANDALLMASLPPAQPKAPNNLLMWLGMIGQK